MLINPNAQTQPKVDLSDALSFLLEDPIKSDAYPGCTLVFKHLNTKPSVSIPIEMTLEMKELGFEEQSTLMQEVRLISKIINGDGKTLGESECRCVLSAQEGSNGTLGDIKLILDHTENVGGLVGEYNLSVISRDKLNELIFKQEASEYLHIKAQEKYPLMDDLKNHVYNLGLCADFIKDKYHQDPNQYIITSPDVRNAFEEPLKAIQNCISLLQEEMPSENANSLKPLKEYTKLLQEFLEARPLGMFLKLTFGMNRALSKLFQYAESSEALKDTPDLSMELRATSDALCVHYRSDFLLNQFGSICHTLYEEAKSSELNYEKISKLLHSPHFREYPVSEFSFGGEHLLIEILSFTRIADFIDEELKNISTSKDSSTIEQGRKLLNEFVELAFEFNHWWKLHSLFDVVDYSHDKSENDHQYASIIKQSPFQRITHLDLNDGSLSTVQRIIYSIIEFKNQMNERNSHFGDVPTYSITRYSSWKKLSIENSDVSYKDFPSPMAAIPEKMIDEISALEEKNMYSAEKNNGLTYATGEENLRFFLEECNAAIYGAYDRGRKIGGDFVVLPNEEHLPEPYRNKLSKAKSIGIVPFNSICLWGEVLVVDKSIKSEFKSAKRIGSVEFCESVRRHEAGRAAWEDRGNEVSTISTRPMYLTAMVGVDNIGAIAGYLSNGWILPMTPESIVEDNGSKYYLMAKPFASEVFRYELR